MEILLHDCNSETGYSDILHIKTFNPLDDWYGLSPMECAQYSIDQHNECIKWNKALLENGARPSGALTVKGNLSEDAFKRLKQDMQDKFSGGKNAGNVMILEGGLDWKEMSISPKDMEFSQTKDAAARDIATAFGVPSQLLGIKGDATYSNMAEARLALWEETIVPIGNNILSSIANWLAMSYNLKTLNIKIDVDSISALSEKRQQMWQTVNNSNFLSNQEKRNEIGFSGSTQNKPNNTSQNSTQMNENNNQQSTTDNNMTEIENQNIKDDLCDSNECENEI